MSTDPRLVDAEMQAALEREKRMDNAEFFPEVWTCCVYRNLPERYSASRIAKRAQGMKLNREEELEITHALMLKANFVGKSIDLAHTDSLVGRITHFYVDRNRDAIAKFQIYKNVENGSLARDLLNEHKMQVSGTTTEYHTKFSVLKVTAQRIALCCKGAREGAIIVGKENAEKYNDEDAVAYSQSQRASQVTATANGAASTTESSVPQTAEEIRSLLLPIWTGVFPSSAEQVQQTTTVAMSDNKSNMPDGKEQQQQQHAPAPGAPGADGGAGGGGGGGGKPADAATGSNGALPPVVPQQSNSADKSAAETFLNQQRELERQRADFIKTQKQIQEHYQKQADELKRQQEETRSRDEAARKRENELREKEQALEKKRLDAERKEQERITSEQKQHQQHQPLSSPVQPATPASSPAHPAAPASSPAPAPGALGGSDYLTHLQSQNNNLLQQLIQMQASATRASESAAEERRKRDEDAARRKMEDERIHKEMQANKERKGLVALISEKYADFTGGTMSESQEAIVEAALRNSSKPQDCVKAAYASQWETLNLHGVREKMQASANLPPSHPKSNVDLKTGRVIAAAAAAAAGSEANGLNGSETLPVGSKRHAHSAFRRDVEDGVEETTTEAAASKYQKLNGGARGNRPEVKGPREIELCMAYDPENGGPVTMIVAKATERSGNGKFTLPRRHAVPGMTELDLNHGMVKSLSVARTMANSGAALVKRYCQQAGLTGDFIPLSTDQASNQALQNEYFKAAKGRKF